jgi:hypothetical protein
MVRGNFNEAKDMEHCQAFSTPGRRPEQKCICQRVQHAPCDDRLTPYQPSPPSQKTPQGTGEDDTDELSYGNDTPDEGPPTHRKFVPPFGISDQPAIDGSLSFIAE